jgi:hypothetical protein
MKYLIKKRWVLPLITGASLIVTLDLGTARRKLSMRYPSYRRFLAIPRSLSITRL